MPSYARHYTIPHDETPGLIELQQPFKSSGLKGCFYDLLQDGLKR